MIEAGERIEENENEEEQELPVSTTEFRNGLKLEIDGEPYIIVEFQHVKPGKGGAKDGAASGNQAAGILAGAVGINTLSNQGPASEIQYNYLHDFGRSTWADYDRDGDLDAFVSRGERPNALLVNDGAAHFTTTP